MPTEESELHSKYIVVAMLDSHSMRHTIQNDWPPAGLFIHAGDLTQYGTKGEL